MKKFIILFLALVLILSGCFHKQSQSIKSNGKRKTQPKEGPVIIGKKIKKKVKVFFVNQEKEDEAFKKYDPEDPRAHQYAFPVNRTVYTSGALPKDTINELLKGPSAEEKPKGYRTEIHNVSLESFYIDAESGKATVKLSGKDFYLDGDMSGPRVRAQIEKTLLQFSIKEVTIYINGNPKFDSLKG